LWTLIKKIDYFLAKIQNLLFQPFSRQNSKFAFSVGFPPKFKFWCAEFPPPPKKFKYFKSNLLPFFLELSPSDAETVQFPTLKGERERAGKRR
jgi:hypothetical protein